MGRSCPDGKTGCFISVKPNIIEQVFKNKKFADFFRKNLKISNKNIDFYKTLGYTVIKREQNGALVE